MSEYRVDNMLSRTVAEIPANVADAFLVGEDASPDSTFGSRSSGLLNRRGRAADEPISRESVQHVSREPDLATRFTSFIRMQRTRRRCLLSLPRRSHSHGLGFDSEGPGGRHHASSACRRGPGPNSQHLNSRPSPSDGRCTTSDGPHTVPAVCRPGMTRYAAISPAAHATRAWRSPSR
jgi:hypothetical protein